MDIKASLPVIPSFGIPSTQQPDHGDIQSKYADQGPALLTPPPPQNLQENERSDEPTELEKYINEHPEVETQLRQLDQLHVAHRGITRELQQAIHEVEKRYLARYQKLYDQRKSVINAIAQGIPGFWLQALKNNPLVSAEIEEHDEPALQYLKDIRLEYLEKPGFALHFEFNENEYFEERTLTKTFAYVPDDEHFAGELVYGEVTGCDIHWKDGKNFTKREEYDEDGNLLGSYVLSSFFDFFETPEDEDEEDHEGEIEDEEEDEEDEEEEEEEEEEEDDEEETWQEIHFAIGEEFSEKIIPYALQWYTGEAALYESDDDDDEDDEDDEEDGEDDGEDEEDEEEEEDDE